MIYSDTLKIKREDITLGYRGQTECCAVAQAVKRQIIKNLSGDYYPCVEGSDGIWLCDPETTDFKYQIVLNKKDEEKIEQFINEFDLIDDNDELLKSEIEPIEVDFTLVKIECWKRRSTLK